MFVRKDPNEPLCSSKLGVGKMVDKWHVLGYNMTIWHLGGNYDTKDEDL